MSGGNVLSLPTRERGLKSQKEVIKMEYKVAPHAGAWIEIWSSRSSSNA